MAISVSQLPPKYQQQVLKKYLEQTRQKTDPVPKPGKSGKYHNTPDERSTSSGAVLRFDSRKEARRYDSLMLLVQAGTIRDLRLQVDFTLQEAYTDTEGNRVRAIRYRADFTYQERDSTGAWRLVVEDVKSQGTRTDKYKIKKKMLKERYGLDVIEV